MSYYDQIMMRQYIEGQLAIYGVDINDPTAQIIIDEIMARSGESSEEHYFYYIVEEILRNHGYGAESTQAAELVRYILQQEAATRGYDPYDPMVQAIIDHIISQIPPGASEEIIRNMIYEELTSRGY